MKFFILILALTAASIYAEPCIDKCVERMLEEDPTMIPAVAWHLCKDECQFKLASSNGDIKRCIDDVSRVIADMRPIPSLARRRDLRTLIKYLSDIILTVRDGATSCKDIDLESALVYIQEFLPEKYRGCYSNSVHVVFESKELVRLWKRKEIRKIKRKLEVYIKTVRNTYNSCRTCLPNNGDDGFDLTLA